MKKLFAFLILCLWLAGCHEGKVTDVGNPNIDLPEAITQAPAPSTEQLVGSFSVSIFSASGTGPAATPTQCQSNLESAKKILATQNPNQVILENFFGYSPSTQRILADYNKQTGFLSFTISDNTAVMTCSGQTLLENNFVSLFFSCDVDKPVDHNCTLSFRKE